MRPTTERQSALRAPLDYLLRTESNVRVLRVLGSSSEPLTKSEIARRANLNQSGVGRTVEQLIELDLLETVGVGSRKPVQLRRQHPLAAPLMQLFAAEADRFESLVDDLTHLVASLKPAPRAAWIEGPLASGSDEPWDPVTVGILASAGHVDRLVSEFEKKVAALERRYDVLVEAKTWTAADLQIISSEQEARLSQTIPLTGPPAHVLVSQPPARPRKGKKTHATLDGRALAIATEIARRLESDPSLIDRAMERIDRRLRDADPRERRQLLEWRRLFRTSSRARLKRLLTSRSERGTRLRQSLPFLGILSPAELHTIREAPE
jgi:IclR helix-turn-helix domain